MIFYILGQPMGLNMSKQPVYDTRIISIQGKLIAWLITSNDNLCTTPGIITSEENPQAWLHMNNLRTTPLYFPFKENLSTFPCEIYFIYVFRSLDISSMGALQD